MFFGITDTLYGQIIIHPNRAYAGFPRIVWSVANNSQVPAIFHPLHQHAERVALFLSQGNTIEAALKEANKRVQTCDSVGVKMDMVLKGDPYSRLQYVYMSATEWDETKRYSWYLVYSP